MAAYYNEKNRKLVLWLRQLISAGVIADGDVDDRPIELVRPEDVRGYAQCHWFAGVGGWSYALRLAGWPDTRPVYTFSCPCQKFSSATRGRAVAADLWPEQRRILVANRPGVFFGEQVAQAGEWFDGLCADVEAVGYEVGAAVLPALSVGLDHARPRIVFVGHADRDGESSLPVDAEMARLPRGGGEPGEVGGEDGLSADMVALSGFGNAIVPPLVAEFIGAYMDICEVNR